MIHDASRARRAAWGAYSAATAVLLTRAMLAVAVGVLGACHMASTSLEVSSSEEDASSNAAAMGGSSSSAAKATADQAAPNSTPNPIANTIAGYLAVGRFADANGDGLTFSLPMSRIGGNFTGTTLGVRLLDTGYDYFDVVLDGNLLVAPFWTSQTPCLPLAQAQAIDANITQTNGCIGTTPGTAPQTYVVARNLSPGPHTAWLIKRTEFLQGSGTSSVGRSTFFGFVLDAEASLLTPPAARARRIDFAGDSAFTGYGAGQIVHGDDDNCSATAQNQDAAASIPYYVSELLLADGIDASSSGQGVVASVYDSNPAHLLPALYEEALPPAAQPLQDFNQRPADVVVLNAGGDDLLGASGSGYFPNHDANAFVAGYAAWLAKIRQHYPKAFIVCALTAAAKTDDIATLGDALQAAVAQAQSTGDTEVAYFNFFTEDPPYTTYDDIAQALKLYYGCKYHPSPAGAAWLARRLAQFIAGRMGWPPPPSGV